MAGHPRRGEDRPRPGVYFADLSVSDERIRGFTRVAWARACEHAKPWRMYRTSPPSRVRGKPSRMGRTPDPITAGVAEPRYGSRARPTRRPTRTTRMGLCRPAPSLVVACPHAGELLRITTDNDMTNSRTAQRRAARRRPREHRARVRCVPCRAGLGLNSESGSRARYTVTTSRWLGSVPRETQADARHRWRSRRFA
jgi:hypothetical protein